MRPSKNFSYSLAALLLSSCLCGPWAHAANASFGVQVRVVRHDVPLAPVDVPVPPDARKMTSSAAGESYVFSGKSSTAAEFFHRAMAERGYREIPAGKDDAVLTWERDGHRVRIRIDAVLGSKDTSRIMVDNADA